MAGKATKAHVKIFKVVEYFIFVAYPRFFFRDQPITLVSNIQRIPKTPKHPVRERSVFNLDLSVCDEDPLCVCSQNAYCPHSIRTTLDNYCLRLVFGSENHSQRKKSTIDILSVTPYFPLIYWRLAGNARFNCHMTTGTEPFVISDRMWLGVPEE